VMIDGILEIANPKGDGVDHVKEALAAAKDADEESIDIHYIGAPRYRISVVATDYKEAEQEMKAAVGKVTAAVEKSGGSVSFKRKEEK